MEKESEKMHHTQMCVSFLIHTERFSFFPTPSIHYLICLLMCTPSADEMMLLPKSFLLSFIFTALLSVYQ